MQHADRGREATRRPAGRLRHKCASVATPGPVLHAAQPHLFGALHQALYVCYLLILLSLSGHLAGAARADRKGRRRRPSATARGSSARRGRRPAVRASPPAQRQRPAPCRGRCKAGGRSPGARPRRRGPGARPRVAVPAAGPRGAPACSAVLGAAPFMIARWWLLILWAGWAFIDVFVLPGRSPT